MPSTDISAASKAGMDAELYLAVFEQTRDAIYIVDPDTGRFIDCNQAATDMTGWSLEQLTRMTLMDLRPPLERSATAEATEGLAVKSGDDDLQTYHLRADGSQVPVEVSLSKVETGGRSFNVAMVRDVSERVEDRERTQDTEERLRSFIENIPGVAYVKDTATRHLAVSSSFADLLHTTKDEVLGKTNAEVFPPEVASSLSAVDARVIADGEVVDAVEQVAGRLWHSLKFPIRTAGGGVFIGGISIDVTEQVERAEKLIEERTAELASSNLQLRSAVDELEAFTYSVSHDLRAPLRAIDGFTEALMEDHQEELSPEARHYLGLVSGSADRMGELIDDLLTLSRLGQREMSLDFVDMSTLAMQLFEETAPSRAEREVGFTAEETPQVRVDAGLMRQALFNLIDNAVKFTRNTPAAQITFGVDRTGGEDVFYVRDNGTGFDMAYKDKLFRVFQRLHTQDAFEGTGVGLAIVERVIRRHGGRIWAESAPGQGSTFYFTLPTAAEPGVLLHD